MVIVVLAVVLTAGLVTGCRKDRNTAGPASVEPTVPTAAFTDLWNPVATRVKGNPQDALTRDVTFNIDLDDKVYNLRASVLAPKLKGAGGSVYTVYWAKDEAAPKVECKATDYPVNTWPLISASALINELNALGLAAINPKVGEYAAVEIKVEREGGRLFGAEPYHATYIFKDGKTTRADASHPVFVSGTIVTVSVSPVGDKAEFSPENHRVYVLQSLGATVEPAQLPDRKLADGERIEGEACGDVNGDGRPEIVILFSLREPTSAMKGLWMEVYDQDGDVKRYDLNTIDGVMANRLRLADLDGDSTPEVMVTEIVGGSGNVSMLDVYSLKGDNLNVLFKAADAPKIEGPRSTLKKGKFTLQIASRNLSWLLNVPADPGSGFAEVEDPSWIDPFSAYDFADLDGDGLMDIVGHQLVAYYTHPNIMGDLRQIYRLKDGQYKLADTQFFVSPDWWVSPYPPRR
jgi:hypothetical protein